MSMFYIMLFPGLNLLLDVVNVTCFARADSAFGLDTIRREGAGFLEHPSESKAIIKSKSKYFDGEDCGRELESAVTGRLRRGTGDGDDGHVVYPQAPAINPNNLVNLNMCSAWTVLSLLW
jgi:hypothetical protein